MFRNMREEICAKFAQERCTSALSPITITIGTSHPAKESSHSSLRNSHLCPSAASFEKLRNSDSNTVATISAPTAGDPSPLALLFSALFSQMLRTMDFRDAKTQESRQPFVNAWSEEDDLDLVLRRAQGLDWDQILFKHFAAKSPMGVGQLYRVLELLIERRDTEQWNSVKPPNLNQVYNRIPATHAHVDFGTGIDPDEDHHKVTAVSPLRMCETRKVANRQASKKGMEDGAGFEPLIPDRPQEQSLSSIQSTLQTDDSTVLPDPASSTTDAQSGGGGRQFSPSGASLTVDTAITLSLASSTLSEQSDSERCVRTEASTISHTSGTPEHSLSSDSQDLEITDTISPQKQIILDRLMMQFYEIVNASSPGYHRHGCSESSSAQSVQPPSVTASAKGRTKRKSTNRNDSQEDDEAGEGSGKRHKRNGDDSKCNTMEKKGFACPYFKHNPQKYHYSKPCSGPGGWGSVHRLKHVFPVSPHEVDVTSH
jgi:hypothetical protein